MMRSFVWIAWGVILMQASAPAQTTGADTLTAEVATSADNPTSLGATATTGLAPEFVPMTTSERARLYLKATFGPGAVMRAAAAGAFAQATNTPKEWGGGGLAFGERIGSAFAQYTIREALEFGGSMALHEDNRYVRSTDTAFFNRTKHVVASVFVARNEAGHEHFAYSRFGSVLGSAFVARLWQPRSEDSAGAALDSFGLTMAADLGWNFVKEFGPSVGKHFRKH
jgi:hypothetical protein